MAEFFFSVPGALSLVGLGILVLSRASGARRPTARTRATAPADPVTPVMQIVVSVVMLAAGLWVILSGRYNAEAVHWASGAIGTVVGYWLKP